MNYFYGAYLTLLQMGVTSFHYSTYLRRPVHSLCGPIRTVKKLTLFSVPAVSRHLALWSPDFPPPDKPGAIIWVSRYTATLQPNQ